MKRISWIVIVIIVLTCLAGCSTKEAINESNNLINAYYLVYDECDIPEMVDMYHSSLIENLGGRDSLELRLKTRRMLLGEVKSFEIINTGFKTVNSDSEVYLTCNVEYDSGEQAEEKYTFLTIDDGLYITAIDLPGENIVNELVDDFCNSIGDTERMMSLYIPYAQDNLNISYIDQIGKITNELGGSYVDYEIQSRQYVDVGADTYNVILALEVEIEFDDMKFMSELQYAYENGDIGLSFEKTYPYPVYELAKEYYLSINNKDTDEILSLYSDDFFVLAQTDKNSWNTDFITPIISNYGNFIGYDIQSFLFSYEDVLGTQKPVLTAYLISEYEDAKFIERISFLFENGYKIVGHYAEITESY